MRRLRITEAFTNDEHFRSAGFVTLFLIKLFKANMATSESTCWTVIRAGAPGSPAYRDEVGRRYLGIVQSYFSARWRGSALRKGNGCQARLSPAVEEFEPGGRKMVAEKLKCGHFPTPKSSYLILSPAEQCSATLLFLCIRQYVHLGTFVRNSTIH